MKEETASLTTSLLISPGEGTVLNAFNNTIQVKVSGEQSGGRFALGFVTVPPGVGPPPHRHRAEDELFLVSEGRFEFWVGGQWIEAAPGSVVYTPRGVVHTFKNVGDDPGRAWVMAAPSGFETFFAKCGQVFAEAGSGPPDLARILSISDEHQIEYVPPLGPPQAVSASVKAETTLLAAATIIVPPGDGPVLQAFGDTLQVKLAEEHTRGTLSVSLGTIPPSGGPPSHRHLDEDELFLVLEGHYHFLVQGEWADAVPGSVVYIPRGVVHTFKNAADTPSRAWIVTTPGGFPSFFGKCAAVFAEADAGPPDMARIFSISDEHGIEFVPPLAAPA